MKCLHSICVCQQIGDFGMARDLMDDTYYTAKTKGGKIPVKWTAPEVHPYTLGSYLCDYRSHTAYLLPGSPL